MSSVLIKVPAFCELPGWDTQASGVASSGVRLAAAHMLWLISDLLEFARDGLLIAAGRLSR